METIGNLFNVLAASDAMIQQSAMRIPGYDAPLPFRFELRTLRQRQQFLRQRLLDFQGRQSSVNLGVAPLIIAAGAGAVLGLSAIGGWIYSHFTEAKILDEQTKIYQDMRAEGTDARRAADIVFGAGTDWGAVMRNLVILSIVGAGIFLLVKVVK